MCWALHRVPSMCDTLEKKNDQRAIIPGMKFLITAAATRGAINQHYATQLCSSNCCLVFFHSKGSTQFYYV